MASVAVVDKNGKKLKEIELNAAIFEGSINESVLHAAIKMYQANLRQGNACAKGRSDVTGSSKKLWKQKGTGRARAGSVKNPVWRGGGVVFGPKPRSFREDMPKKVRRLALLSALRSRVQNNEFIVINELAMTEPKTKNMATILKALEIPKGALVITNELDHNVVKSSRNIPKVSVQEAGFINAFDVLSHNKVLITEQAVESLEKRLSEYVGQ